MSLSSSCAKMSASKCEEDVVFVSFAADLSLLITVSAVATVSFVGR